MQGIYSLGVEDATKERLDRAVGNATWQEVFPAATVTNGEHYKSDHRPLIIDLEPVDVVVHRSGGRKKFEVRLATRRYGGRDYFQCME